MLLPVIPSEASVPRVRKADEESVPGVDDLRIRLIKHRPAHWLQTLRQALWDGVPIYRDRVTMLGTW
ncbi:MAG: hypothetical protein U1D67_00040, partial [Dehalococcoidia bacterium]|nr:hypothetical protein [Dehalococcoidia bacterium]